LSHKPAYGNHENEKQYHRNEGNIRRNIHDAFMCEITKQLLPPELIIEKYQDRSIPNHRTRIMPPKSSPKTAGKPGLLIIWPQINAIKSITAISRKIAT